MQSARVPSVGAAAGRSGRTRAALRPSLLCALLLLCAWQTQARSDEAEPLPILMDEILVNFDEDRASRAARTIEDLARRHQILYFTYREETPLRPGRVIRLAAPVLAAAG